MTDLNNRTARCSCGKTAPSNGRHGGFFEYRGEGSRWATDGCVHCGYTKNVHQEINPHTGRPGITTTSATGMNCDPHAFKPRGPNEFDMYYCGCNGWD